MAGAQSPQLSTPSSSPPTSPVRSTAYKGRLKGSKNKVPAGTSQQQDIKELTAKEEERLSSYISLIRGLKYSNDDGRHNGSFEDLIDLFARTRKKTRARTYFTRAIQQSPAFCVHLSNMQSPGVAQEETLQELERDVEALLARLKLEPNLDLQRSYGLIEWEL